MSEYVYEEFPKVKYHPKYPPRTVQNVGEEKTLGRGWVNSPNQFPKPSRIRPTLRKFKSFWLEWKWLTEVIAWLSGLGALVRVLLWLYHRKG